MRSRDWSADVCSSDLLDVVKTTVMALRGTVGVTSQPGAGTRFVLSLPLTLSAFSALLMRVGTSTFAVELENTLRVLTLSADDIVSADGRHVVIVGQRQVPVIALAELLEMKEARAEGQAVGDLTERSEEHTSELQSLMRISYAVFC